MANINKFKEKMNIKNMNKIKENIKLLLKHKIDELPSPLYSRFIKIIGCGIAIILSGIIGAIVFHGPQLSALYIMLLPLLAGIVLIIYAYWYKYKLIKEGYNILQGYIRQYNYRPAVSARQKFKKVHSILVEAEDDFYQIPFHQEFPVNIPIIIYLPADNSAVEINGVYSLSSVWGYQIEKN